MSSVIPRNCDKVIVNFVCRSQTLVDLKEFKEHVEESKSVVLSDEQAMTLFHSWLESVDADVDGQKASVDVELWNDNDMDWCMENLWDDVVDYNIKIPDDWRVSKFVDCEHPSPEVKEVAIVSNKPEVKEVAIVSNKPEVIDWFKGKTVEDAEMLALKDEVATLKAENNKLKERIRSVVKHFEMMIASII